MGFVNPDGQRKTIAIDVSRANVAKRTGVEWYAWHLVQELKRVIPPEYRVVLYSREPLLPDFGELPKNWEVRVLNWPPRRLWTQLRLSWEMLVRAPDLLFVPVHVLPLILPRRRILTLHDVAFVSHPEAYSLAERLYQAFAVRYASWRASLVLTISQFSKSELMNIFSVPEKKLAVTPLGCEADEFAPPTDDERRLALRRLNLEGRKYFLYVGRIEAKKNTMNLLRAYRQYRVTSPDPSRLVLVGKLGYGGEVARRMVAEDQVLREAVSLLGYASNEDLRALYAGASAFLFPSWYEGFGLPVLEAMAARVPVIAARASALPEVCGSSALFVPPDDINGWTAAMRQIEADVALRARLVADGRERVSHYTWRQTAELTWGALRALL